MTPDAGDDPDQWLIDWCAGYPDVDLLYIERDKKYRGDEPHWVGYFMDNGIRCPVSFWTEDLEDLQKAAPNESLRGLISKMDDRYDFTIPVTVPVMWRNKYRVSYAGDVKAGNAPFDLQSTPGDIARNRYARRAS